MLLVEVETYFCAERRSAKFAEDGTVIPASIIVMEKPFSAAHWSSGSGKVIPRGAAPSDPMPVTREIALELVNRWNRFSEHGQGEQGVKFWIK